MFISLERLITWQNDGCRYMFFKYLEAVYLPRRLHCELRAGILLTLRLMYKIHEILPLFCHIFTFLFYLLSNYYFLN